VTDRSLPTRTLSDRPNLDQLKRQAKELLDSFRAGTPDATREVRAHYRNADPATFALHDAQLVLARAYGFGSWPKLKAFADGVTVCRLVDAVRAGDLGTVRAMVAARPELVHIDVAENDEHRALHHAVLARHADIARFLMQHGADADKGIWPHRTATTALTLAHERGYDEIVEIIVEEENRRSQRTATRTSSSSAASRTTGERRQLLSDAVAANRPDLLRHLLDSGLDANEPERVEGLEELVPSWGSPLRLCAIAGNTVMAEMLLAHGANPNTNVYAASAALYEAYKRDDREMIALLEKHGGRLDAIAIGDLGLVESAEKLLACPDGNDLYDLLWGAIESPSPEIVERALRVVEWPRDDSRWYGILENGLYLGPHSDRPRYLDAFKLVLERFDPNVQSGRGTTLLHEVAASRGGLTADDRIAYSTLLLDRGARVDLRDKLLLSTPLGWACRWGRPEMVRLLLDRGADPIEADAEPWATPAAWAKKMGHHEIDRSLRGSGGSGGRGDLTQRARGTEG
jgi:ankyrin repeat protein